MEATKLKNLMDVCLSFLISNIQDTQHSYSCMVLSPTPWHPSCHRNAPTGRNVDFFFGVSHLCAAYVLSFLPSLQRPLFRQFRRLAPHLVQLRSAVSATSTSGLSLFSFYLSFFFLLSWWSFLCQSTPSSAYAAILCCETPDNVFSWTVCKQAQNSTLKSYTIP